MSVPKHWLLGGW